MGEYVSGYSRDDVERRLPRRLKGSRCECGNRLARGAVLCGDCRQAEADMQAFEAADARAWEAEWGPPSSTATFGVMPDGTRFFSCRMPEWV